MKPSMKEALPSAITIGLMVAALATATGLAFAGWVENGARIMMSMAETGLSWCF